MDMLWRAGGPGRTVSLREGARMRFERFVLPALLILTGCAGSQPYPMQTRALERCAPYKIAPPDVTDVTPPKLVEQGHLVAWSDEMSPGRPGGMPGRPAFNPAQEGWACLQYTINSEGRVENVDVVATSYPEFGGWAARRLSADVYEPARRNGKPIAFRWMIAVANEGVGHFPLAEFAEPPR